jgi:hypothetical protein
MIGLPNDESGAGWSGSDQYAKDWPIAKKARKRVLAMKTAVFPTHGVVDSRFCGDRYVPPGFITSRTVGKNDS